MTAPKRISLQFLSHLSKWGGFVVDKLSGLVKTALYSFLEQQRVEKIALLTGRDEDGLKEVAKVGTPPLVLLLHVTSSSSFPSFQGFSLCDALRLEDSHRAPGL